MNKQINHIVYAHILLTAIAAGYFFIKNISVDFVKQDGVGNYGNVEPVYSNETSNGRGLFMSKCASCHSINNDLTGLALAGFEERGPWTDRKKLYEWIKNPSLFMKSDSYTQKLKQKYNSMMAAFPAITTEEVDAIAAYISQRGPF